MRTVTISGQDYLVDDRVQSFGVNQKPSSNIEFFGSDPFNNFFVQFKNGTSYIYSKVDSETLDQAIHAESIGKFFNTRISKKFQSVKFNERFINPIQ